MFVFILLIAGLYPAIVLSASQPALSLKGGFTNGIGKNNYRSGLLIFQFTVSLILLIATMAVNKQIHYIMNKDMGFKKEAIINLKIPADKRDLSTKKLLIEKLNQLPNIAQVSLHRDTPLSTRHGHTSIKHVSRNRNRRKKRDYSWGSSRLSFAIIA